MNIDALRLMNLDAWSLMAAEFSLRHTTLYHPWLTDEVADFLSWEGYERLANKENYKFCGAVMVPLSTAARYLRFAEAARLGEGGSAIYEHLMARYALFTL